MGMSTTSFSKERGSIHGKLTTLQFFQDQVGGFGGQQLRGQCTAKSHRHLPEKGLKALWYRPVRDKETDQGRGVYDSDHRLRSSLTKATVSVRVRPSRRLRQRFAAAKGEPRRSRTSCWLMERHHYRVSRSEGGWEALEHLRRGTFAAVLAEVDMPGMDGLELARRIVCREGPSVIQILPGGEAMFMLGGVFHASGSNPTAGMPL
jgi:CheY-like chemotaxis protein